MPSKEGTCFRILRKYGFMIGGPKEALITIKRLPAVNGKETFKQWKKRVFGANIKNILVYAPYDPAPQTRISTIISESGGGHLSKMFSQYKQFKNKELVAAVEETESEVTKKLSTFPKETLMTLMYEFEKELQPSVKECLINHMRKTDENIDTESLLKDLLLKYNNVVKAYKLLENKQT